MSGLVLDGQGFSTPKDQKAVPPVISPLLGRGLFVGGYSPGEHILIAGLNNCHNDPTAAQTSSAIVGFSEPSSEVSHPIDTSYNRILHDSSPIHECITVENSILQWSPIPSHSCFDFPFHWAQNNTQIDPGPIDGLVNDQVRNY
jgi:hypothetical protein